MKGKKKTDDSSQRFDVWRLEYLEREKKIRDGNLSLSLFLYENSEKNPPAKHRRDKTRMLRANSVFTNTSSPARIDVSRVLDRISVALGRTVIFCQFFVAVTSTRDRDQDEIVDYNEKKKKKI